MPTNLRFLLEEASSAVQTYIRPNLEQLRLWLNPVLTALGEGSIRRDDKVVVLEERPTSEPHWYIRTTYYIRGCECEDVFHLPSAIVDAADPLEAARDAKSARDLATAEHEVNRLEAELERARAKLVALKAGL